jgi:ribosome-binding protein aMBF1 (putative translation factor)
MFSPTRLRAAREAAGLSKEALAVALNRPFWTLNAWERGTSAPSIANAQKLARALGLSIDDLVEDSE